MPPYNEEINKMTRKYEYQLQMNGHQTGVRCGYVFVYGNYIILRSYNTIIAFINTKTDKFYIRDYYSRTTSRHVTKFLNDNGFKSVYKKDYPKYKYHRWDKIIEKVHLNFTGCAY